MTRHSSLLAAFASVALATPAWAAPPPLAVELGAFGGVILPSKHHSFVGSVIRPSQESTTFDSVAADFGVRFSLAPLPYLGLEAEGAMMLPSTSDGKSALWWAPRAHFVGQPFDARVKPFVLAGAGGLLSRSDALGNDGDPALHFGIGCKANITDSILLRLDLRDTITNKKAGSSYPHHPEVLFGVSGYLTLFGQETPSTESREAQQPPRDTDRDGFADDLDRCPTQAGVSPDGCPAPDADGDGFPDASDRCPAELGIAPDGCPAKDSDNDGFTDDLDKCPNQPGSGPAGCPPVDTDNDGIADPNDRCPSDAETKNGYVDADGCPDQLPENVQPFNGVVDGIEFERGAPSLRAESLPILDAAAQLLAMYPEFHLAITVYDHGKGDAEEARSLSQARADAVREYLIAKGVTQDRLSSQAGERGQGADGGEGRRVVFALLPKQ